MTNEPPTGDGEELVENDLPGLNEPADPPATPEPELTRLERLELSLESAEAQQRAVEEEKAGRGGPAGSRGPGGGPGGCARQRPT